MGWITVSHPFGNPNSYNAALAFHEAGLLACFHTCLFAPFGLRRRHHRDLAGAPIRIHPYPELLRLSLGSFGRTQAAIDRIGLLFDRSVAAGLSQDDGGIYAYEDWACDGFLRARDLGLTTCYELPAAYFTQKQRWVDEETGREPELRPFFPAMSEPVAKLERKQRELAMADVVVCPSTFVRKTIADQLSHNPALYVFPYGADTTVSPKVWRRSDFERPLRLIYAGALSPHKGLHYLFQALASLPFYSYILTLAGRWAPGFRAWLSRRYAVHYEYCGQLRPSELNDAYRANHALVFPSLCDGFGLVILEAMAAGLPVIATERTGAPDILAHGEDGFLVRAGRPEDLVNAIEVCLDDPEALAEMGQRARRKAEELSWTTYRRRLVGAVSAHLHVRQALFATGHAAIM